MQKKMIHIQIEKHTENFTKLLSFDCHLTKNEPRNAVNWEHPKVCVNLQTDVR